MDGADIQMEFNRLTNFRPRRKWWAIQGLNL